MFKLEQRNSFVRDLKKLKKQKKDLKALYKVIDLLQKGSNLPRQYHDHPLKNNLKGYRECHIQPDWLLIYKIEKDELVLVLSRTGSHSEVLDL